MKKYFNFAFLSAIALAGTFGLTACSSSDDLAADTNPNYNPNTGEVAVDFVMNVSTGNTATTRMTAANTQADITQAFRGITSASLMTYSQTDNGKSLATATEATKDYSLGTVLTNGYLDPDGSGSTPKSRRVLELTLPTGTNTLLFWGKAIKSGENSDNAQGKIDWVVNKNISQNSFKLAKRIPEGNGEWGQNAYIQYEDLMAKALTKIVQTQATYNVTYGTANTSGTLKWSDYVNVTGTGASATMAPKTNDPSNTEKTMCPLGEVLANAFVQMNTIYENEVRAGSGKSVATTVGDLYKVVESVASATPTSLEEAVAKQVGIAIQTSISNFFSSPSTNPQWQNAATVKTNAGWTPSGGASDLVNGGDLNEFPLNFNAPAGAAILKFEVLNSSNERSFTYSYNDNIPTYSMSGTSGGTFNIFNYRYPAELCYFGNSPVRVTNDSHVTSDYPDGVANWDNDANWEAGKTGTGSAAWTKNGKVLSTTRSVAMQNNINYGTALLKTTVRYNTGELEDNNHNIQNDRRHVNEDNKKIDVTQSGIFTLSGVLIGGVEEEMGWNYVAKATTPTFSSFIYDSDIAGTAIPAYTGGESYSSPNYTLVWDNWNQNSKGQKQNVVYVALEFVNHSGTDFWGMNNLIRNGATFYITGKLDPNATTAAKLSELGVDQDGYNANKSLGITWPTNYALPPYETDGSTIKERRIFIQDYMTTANFIIGKESLQSALVAVPDLRSSQLSLGLSVDLQWSTGLNFDSVLGQ